MAVIEVLLEIPDRIVQGLASGELVRNAAGVVRDAQGHIVAHLKEISAVELQMQQAPVAGAMEAGACFAGLAALQVVSTAMIMGKLNAMEKKIDAIAQDVRAVHRSVQNIDDRQLIELVAVANTAVDYASIAKDPDELKRAVAKCLDARSAIINYLRGARDADICENITYVHRFLRILGVLCCVEYELHLRLERPDAADSALAFYETSFGSITSRLSSLLQEAQTMLPDQAQLSLLRNKSLVAEIEKSAPLALDYLATERAFIEVGKAGVPVLGAQTCCVLVG